MAKLRIKLTGLCAMTPGGPRRGDTTTVVPGPFHVIMPASAPRKSKNNPSYTIPVHLPVIIVPDRDVAQDSPRRPDDILTTGTGTKNALFLLRRERLWLQDDPNGSLTFLQTNQSPGQEPVGGADEQDVNWITDMREVWQAAQTIDPRCLPTAALPAPQNVALQFTIRSGTITSLWDTTAKRVVEFKPSKGNVVRQTITRHCGVERDLEDALEVTIRSISVDDGSELEPIVLKTRFGEDLAITIGNVDFNDARLLAQNMTTTPHYAADYDFELYYDILANVPAEALSVPVVTGGQGSHSNCPIIRTT